MSAPEPPARGDCKGTCPAAHGRADRPSFPTLRARCAPGSGGSGTAAVRRSQRDQRHAGLRESPPRHFKAARTQPARVQVAAAEKKSCRFCHSQLRRHQATTSGGRTTPTIRIARRRQRPGTPPGRCGFEIFRCPTQPPNAALKHTTSRCTPPQRPQSPRHRPGHRCSGQTGIRQYCRRRSSGRRVRCTPRRR